VFRREGQYWTVRYAGWLARLTDAKGLRQLARLLADPEREFHAVEAQCPWSWCLTTTSISSMCVRSWPSAPDLAAPLRKTI
jgi:hypothetical protein